jgi:hypothetical protein
MKSSVIFLFCLVLAATVASAFPVSATWIEGQVDRRSGQGWKAVSIGDKLDSSDSVRLGPRALAEFTDGQRRVALSTSGFFALETLFKAGGEQAKQRAGALAKLGKMIDPKAAASAGTVAGVRGAAASPSATSWVTEEEGASAYAEEALAYARESRFADAAKLFADAASESEGEKKSGYTYSQAWSLAAGGAVLDAVKILRGMPLAEAGVWVAPRALLLARLDIDTGAAAEARDLLRAALEANLFTGGEDKDLANAMLVEANAAPGL